MIYTKRLYVLCLILIVLSVIAILAYRLLPEKKMLLFPSPVFKTYALGDERIGGNSTARFLDEAHQSWQCSLRQSTTIGRPPFCRFGISLSQTSGDWTSGIDISKFKSVRFQYNYKGPAEFLRVHFRNYDERISQPADFNSAKFMKLLIRDTQGEVDVTYSLSEFVLADWWMRQFSVTANQAKISFERVTSFEVGFEEPIPYGDHQIELRSIELIGELFPEKLWYLCILIFWLVAIALIVSLRLRKLILDSYRQEEYIASMNMYARELKQQSIHSLRLASCDPLTGVLNRFGAKEVIDNVFSSREADEKIALLLFDVDHFKRINDTFGHDFGDKVLKHFAALLLHNIRPRDTVARWGGEEFVVICPQTPRGAAMLVAEKLRSKIEETSFVDGNKTKVTVSVGVTVVGPDESFEEALKRVDRSLYEAKESGRNRWVFNDAK